MKHPTTIAVIASLLGALGMTANAQKAPGDGAAVMKESSPGKATVAQAQTIVATVESVDAAQRQVTLKGPKGKVVPLTVGPDVRNLEQVKVGDRVAVRYLEALSLTLKKDGKALPAAATKASDAARAKAGERPGGAVAEQVTVTAEVTAVDTKTGIVTLKGPKQVVDLQVADPEQLKLIKVGDHIEAVYTQALALSVEPAAAKK